MGWQPRDKIENIYCMRQCIKPFEKCIYLIFYFYFLQNAWGWPENQQWWRGQWSGNWTLRVTDAAVECLIYLNCNWFSRQNIVWVWLTVSLWAHTRLSQYNELPYIIRAGNIVCSCNDVYTGVPTIHTHINISETIENNDTRLTFIQVIWGKKIFLQPLKLKIRNRV